MSLVVWLPLTKDLRQQGLSNATVSIMRGNETWDNNGKLGKCFYANGVNTLQINNIIPQLYNANGYSLCAWFYIESQNTVHSGAGIISGGNWNNQVLNLSVSDWSSDHYTRLRVSGTNWNNTYTYNFYKNIWYHAVVCSDGNKTYAYINGQLIGDTVAGFLPSSIEGNNIAIGGATYYSGMQFFGKINDVRIYDHCLSPMEVKQISQGLILHYPLNRNGWGQENLISGTDDWSSWYKGARWTAENGILTYSAGTVTWVDADSPCIPWTDIDGKTITVSCELRSDDFNYTSGSGFSLCLVRKSSQAAQNHTNRRRECTPIHALKNEAPTTWKHFSHTYINFSDSDFTNTYNGGGGDWFGIYLWNYTNKSIQIKNIKVEIGDKATPWCPNSADALATTMGLNSTTEYDCSGFCNNGIKNNLPTYSSDTAKYCASIHFDGVNQTVQLPNLTTLISDNIFTFNIWFKRLESEPSSKPWETILGGPSGFELESCSANNVHDAKIRAYSWGSGSFAFEFNKWNMLTMISNGTNTLFYLNGELKLTGTYKALVSGNYFLGSWRDTSTQNYKGYMSDARIYATALSASDVKSLYQNCATIDPDGTIRGQIRS